MQEISRINDVLLHGLVTGVGALKLPFAQIGLTAKLHQFIPPLLVFLGHVYYMFGSLSAGNT